MAEHVHFSATLDDGTTLDLVGTKRDLGAMQRLFPKHFGEPFSEDATVDSAHLLAWIIAKREGITDLEFDEFYDRVDLTNLPLSEASPTTT